MQFIFRHNVIYCTNIIGDDYPIHDQALANFNLFTIVHIRHNSAIYPDIHDQISNVNDNINDKKRETRFDWWTELDSDSHYESDQSADTKRVKREWQPIIRRISSVGRDCDSDIGRYTPGRGCHTDNHEMQKVLPFTE